MEDSSRPKGSLEGERSLVEECLDHVEALEKLVHSCSAEDLTALSMDNVLTTRLEHLSEFLRKSATLETRQIGSTPRVIEVGNKGFGTEAQQQEEMPSKKDSVNVLIVDDDEITAKLLGRHLTKFDYTYEYVLKGFDAIDKLFSNPDLFDVVLCDVNMPGLDGGQVLQRVLQAPQLVNLPIVMISSEDNIEKAQNLVRAGARDYLVKPIKSSTLVNLESKLRVWKRMRDDVTQHLNAVYKISQEFLIHLKVMIVSEEKLQELQKGSSGSTEAIEDSVHANVPIECVILNASLPMQKLLGLSVEAIFKGVDLLDFVPAEDVASMKKVLYDSIVGDQTLQRKMLFRWISSTGQFIPVVGTWTVIGNSTERYAEMLVESKSLLPNLILNDEKQRRESAEKLAHETGLALEKLRFKFDTTKRVSDYQTQEFQNLMSELSHFSRLVMENPAVLIWRVSVKDYSVDFVSAQSCKSKLGYSVDAMVKGSVLDTLYKEDVDVMKSLLEGIGNSGRVRRIARSGRIVWFETSTFSWWNKAKGIIVLAEYDVSRYVKPQGDQKKA